MDFYYLGFVFIMKLVNELLVVLMIRWLGLVVLMVGVLFVCW